MESFIQQCINDRTIRLYHNYLLGNSLDLSLFGNDGSDTDVEYADDGVVFPLSTSNITVSDSTSIQLIKGTIVAWCKSGIVSMTADEMLISKRDAGGTNYEFYLNATQLCFYDGTAQTTVTTDVIDDTMVALNFEDFKICEGFVQGESVGDFNAGCMVSVDDAPVVIGNRYTGTSRFKSTLSKLLVFNRKLTPLEHFRVFCELEYDIFVDPIAPDELYDFQLEAKALSIGYANKITFFAPPSILSSELLADNDMESASTSSWSAGNSATLSKQTDSPHGGVRCLRVARNGVNDPYAYQNPLDTGKRYHATGMVRSDGNATPGVGTDNTIFWTGTTSTEWQYFDVTFFADQDWLVLKAVTSTGTEYCEFDNVSCKEITGVLKDGDMEQSGVTFWNAGNSAIVVKQTGTPHGGTRCLRVTYNGTANPYGYQDDILTDGEQYRLIGWARSDGSGQPRVDSGSTTHWTGTTSTEWQKFSAIITADGTTLKFYCIIGSSGYCEFDDVTLEPYPWNGGIKILRKQGEYPYLDDDTTAYATFSDVCNPYATGEWQEIEESNLAAGVWYYYSLFARNYLGIWENNPDTSRSSAYPYERWGLGDYLFKSLPNGWRTADADAGGDLEDFTSIFGAILDNIKTDCEQILTLFDIWEVHEDLLPYIDRKLGWPTWLASNGLHKRVETAAAVALYKYGIGRTGAYETALGNTTDWDPHVVEGWKYIFFSNGIYDSVTPDLSTQPDIDEVFEKRGKRDDILKYTQDANGWHSLTGLGIFLEYLDGISTDLTNSIMKRCEELVENYLKNSYATVEIILEPDSS